MHAEVTSPTTLTSRLISFVMAESKSKFTLQDFATFLFGFSVCYFEMELKPLLDLLNTGFTIIENGLFCGSEHRKRRIAGSIPDFL